MSSNENKYKLSLDNEEYILTTSIENQSLKISCENSKDPKASTFSNYYNFKDLKNFELFDSVNSLEESIDFIDNLFDDAKVSITDLNQDLKIKFYPLKGKEIEFILKKETPKTKIKNEENISTLLPTNNDQNYLKNSNFNTQQQNYNIKIAPTIVNKTIVLPDYINLNNNNQFTFKDNNQNYNNINSNDQYLPNNEQNEEINKVLKQLNEKIKNDNRLRSDNEILKTNIQNYYKQISQCQKQITDLYLEKDKILYENGIKANKINALKIENEQIKNQLTDLDKLRNEAAQVEILKNQLSEMNDIRKRIAELEKLKPQICEIKMLKNQISENGVLRTKLAELSNLKNGNEETEKLKQKIQELQDLNDLYKEELSRLKLSQPQFPQKITPMPQTNNDPLLYEKKVKQVSVKGEIIHNTQELEMLCEKINKNHKKLTLNLIYKASADSDKAEIFHLKCDKANSTIVLIETTKNLRFGGFTNCNWFGENIEKNDETAFIFSLDKMVTYDNIKGEKAIGCYPKFGPIFLGCQIRIYDNFFSNGGTTYQKGLNYYTRDDYELTGGDKEFGVKDIEVYEVIFEEIC